MKLHEEFKLFETMWEDLSSTTYNVHVTAADGISTTHNLSVEKAVEATIRELHAYNVGYNDSWRHVYIEWENTTTGEVDLEFSYGSAHSSATELSDAVKQINLAVHNINKENRQRRADEVAKRKPTVYKTFGRKQYNLANPDELRDWFNMNVRFQHKRHPNLLTDPKAQAKLRINVAKNLRKRLADEGIVDKDILNFLSSEIAGGEYTLNPSELYSY